MYWLDSTMFNGEPVVKLRLQYLFPYVDTFYICEQRYTHQGQRKEQLYIEQYKDWFAPYLSKIRFLIDEQKHEGGSWVFENNHRRYAIPFILEEYKGKQYILSVCDVDEIPDASVVLLKKDQIYNDTTRGCIVMVQKMFYYNLQWFVQIWSRAFFMNDSLLHQHPDVQSFRDHYYYKAYEMDCGWHLSYFFDKYGVQRKLKSFAHKEFNTESMTNLDFLGDAIQKGNLLYEWNPKNIAKYAGTDFPPEFILFNKYIMELQNQP